MIIICPARDLGKSDTIELQRALVAVGIGELPVPEFHGQKHPKREEENLSEIPGRRHDPKRVQWSGRNVPVQDSVSVAISTQFGSDALIWREKVQ